MTIERWTDEMLDRTAQYLESTAQRLDETNRGLAETKAIVESNARAIEANSNAMVEFRLEMTDLRRDSNHMIGIIMQQQSEIRGMQAENRRILDVLLNQRQADEP
jgi:hypothetical protein